MGIRRWWDLLCLFSTVHLFINTLWPASEGNANSSKTSWQEANAASQEREEVCWWERWSCAKSKGGSFASVKE